MAEWEVINADVLQWAGEYDGPAFHAMFCDPPYHLTSITKRFGKAGSKPAQYGKDGAFARLSGGFMNTDWDGENYIAFRPETWAALAEHLYPGAFGMAFASSRGWHRLAVAIEDAGLIIHPSDFLLGYAYGSGFPKSTRVKDNGKNVPGFEGHRYGLQAIKPALEPIIVFQKPYEGRPVDNITATGAGALNIDAGRIEGAIHGYKNGTGGGPETRNGGAARFAAKAMDEWEGNFAGRWPANLILQHTPHCARAGDDWQCFKGWSGRVPFYVYKTGSLSPLDEPSYLLDQLQSLLEVVQHYSTTGNNLLRHAVGYYHNGDILLADSWAGLSHEVLNVLAGSSPPGFQFDCLFCRRLCDALLRSVLVSCLDGLPSLLDVLSDVHSFLTELLHNQQNLNHVHHSSSGDSQKIEQYHDTQQSNKFCISPLPDSLREKLSRILDKQHQLSCEANPIDIVSSSTSESDNRETLDHKLGSTAVVKLLCWASVDLAYRFILPAHIIQRNEIDVKLNVCPVYQMGEQSGESGGGIATRGASTRIYGGGNGFTEATGETIGFGDSGTAARFFYQAHWSYEVLEQLAAADPVFYTAKASSTERNAGLASFPLQTRNRVNPGGLENEPRWAPTQAKNIHPTVKPISLTKYLATLLLPPAAYAPRRILCPFSGSGSEMIGALLAGWDEVIGIEQSPEYWQISQARLAWWADWLTWDQTDVDTILTAAGPEAKETAAKQLGLF